MSLRNWRRKRQEIGKAKCSVDTSVRRPACNEVLCDHEDLVSTMEAAIRFCFFFACIYRNLYSLSKCCKATKKRRREMETKKSNKKIIVAVVVLVALVAALLVIFNLFRAKPVEGSKSITLEVVNQDAETKEYEVHTDAEFLLDAMKDAKDLTFDGETGDYGYTLFTINGETHDWNVDGSYWAIYVNGEYGNYSVDSQPVTDGDIFRFEYTPPYVAE